MQGSSIPMKGQAAMNRYQFSPIGTAVLAPGPTTGPSHHPPCPNTFSFPLHTVADTHAARCSVSLWTQYLQRAPTVPVQICPPCRPPSRPQTRNFLWRNDDRTLPVHLYSGFWMIRRSGSGAENPSDPMYSAPRGAPLHRVPRVGPPVSG